MEPGVQLPGAERSGPGSPGVHLAADFALLQTALLRGGKGARTPSPRANFLVSILDERNVGTQRKELFPDG